MIGLEASERVRQRGGAVVVIAAQMVAGLGTSELVWNGVVAGLISELAWKEVDAVGVVAVRFARKFAVEVAHWTGVTDCALA